MSVIHPPDEMRIVRDGWEDVKYSSGASADDVSLSTDISPLGGRVCSRRYSSEEDVCRHVHKPRRYVIGEPG